MHDFYLNPIHGWPSPLDIYDFHNCREELLNTEDITVVEKRENTGRISAVISPSSHRSKVCSVSKIKNFFAMAECSLKIIPCSLVFAKNYLP
jgi:hypothetical protein